MTKQEIEEIVDGLVEVVGSRNVYDVIDHLNIEVIVTSKMKTMFVRIEGKEYIFLSENEPPELIDFALAHEIGHAVLHDIEMWYFSKLGISKSKYELEADYFAFKLLNKEIDQSYGYTSKQYAQDLCVSEKVVKYIVGE
ncbi:ImmA/IrrE family metallo-endopeptidase [Helcococcus kunzii]|uniref:ImmA/IrrE family metallo-endopeptidase n=1 Tax=Helcococcus kunzii TaxID=40091 RepID=UPI0024AD0382|nr:ImmA/IrrE family metallo-endopeptidase [Helcococcus kunzii]